METYFGHIKTPADAIKLFEACRLGLLQRVRRRLSEKQRQLIKSGSVFIWDEHEAGMRRWTDGKNWSPSRVSGSFLTYREMDGKRASHNELALLPRQSTTASHESIPVSDEELDEESHEQYRYKPDGLMKQTFSITTSTGQNLHLISYYSRSDPNVRNLTQPSFDLHLRHIIPLNAIYPESVLLQVHGQTSAYPEIQPLPHPSFQTTEIFLPRNMCDISLHQYSIDYPWPPSPKLTRNFSPNTNTLPFLNMLPTTAPNNQPTISQAFSSPQINQRTDLRNCENSPKSVLDKQILSLKLPIYASTQESPKLRPLINNHASCPYFGPRPAGENFYSTPMTLKPHLKSLHESLISNSHYSAMITNAGSFGLSGRIPSISSFIYANDSEDNNDIMNKYSRDEAASLADSWGGLDLGSNSWQHMDRSNLMTWRPMVTLDDEDHRALRVLDRKFCV
ncbi:putative camp-independent regulatory protein pac2 [Erysiphe necator]|uniref:Putative camp-independent regulatory protein pac2 n=1 Tax=Uncinula necator TaxID=52586 RepID=A0A0B1P1A8_UNCNE|nr:putative camp-independent regulatory protein pac2 [Erysiphe necator]